MIRTAVAAGDTQETDGSRCDEPLYSHARLDAAAAMIQAGGDPFMVSVEDDPHGDRLDEINGRLVAIQAFLEDEDKT